MVQPVTLCPSRELNSERAEVSLKADLPPVLAQQRNLIAIARSVHERQRHPTIAGFTANNRRLERR